jgi:hypothetical protein
LNFPTRSIYIYIYIDNRLLNNDNEVYSKLKQIVKENLSPLITKEKLISVSFAAIIQTIKADPEMVNLQHIPSTASDSEQHKDNDNNNITRHLEVIRIAY